LSLLHALVGSRDRCIPQAKREDPRKTLFCCSAPQVDQPFKRRIVATRSKEIRSCIEKTCFRRELYRGVGRNLRYRHMKTGGLGFPSDGRQAADRRSLDLAGRRS
jgi:hypothetical protein